MSVIIDLLDNKDINELKELSDNIKSQYDNYFQILISAKNNNPYILVSISDKAVNMGYSANDIIKKIAPIIGGNGGGREKFAQAGGKNITEINKAFEEAKKILK